MTQKRKAASSPHTPAKRDYIFLAPGHHTEIRATRATVDEGVYLVETMQREMYTVTRCPDLDTNKNRAWKQVRP